jgi:hypothetical protein
VISKTLLLYCLTASRSSSLLSNLPLSNFLNMIDSKNDIIIKTTAEFLSTRLSSPNAF